MIGDGRFIEFPRVLPNAGCPADACGMMIGVSSQQHGARQSIFDGFEGYRTPTDEDYRRVLTQGLIVPDANVLLNLYRYNAQTRADLFSVLKKLGNQLWVPHQVLSEFWRNREAAIRDTQAIGTKTVDALEEHYEQSVELLRGWSNRIALAAEDLAELRQVLDQAFHQITEKITARADAAASGLAARSTHSDTILVEFDSVLKGHIGDPMDADDYIAAVKEGVRRVSEGIPPGYMDKDKKDNLAAGDYLVWVQVMDQAATRHSDVLLVTGDVKDDWWRKEQGQLRGPRLELVRELRDRAGTQLYMLRPESLLIHAKHLLRVKVSEESVHDVERVERSLSAGQSAGGPAGAKYALDKLPEGRSGNYLSTIVEMTRLAEDGPDLDTFLDAFQERFPTITLRDVARRRMKNLLSLGLADIVSNRVTLTSLGRQLISEQRIELLQDCLLARIAGAVEVRELAGKTAPGDLRHQLRENPPAGMSATQAILVLRWLEQLDLA
jgi:PIN like domain